MALALPISGRATRFCADPREVIMSVQLQGNTPADVPRFRGKIGSTLVVAFILLAVVPGAIAVITGLYQLQQQTRTQVVNQLQSVVDIKNAQINDWLREKQTILALFLANSSNNTLLLQSLAAGDDQSAAQDSLTHLFNDQFNAQTAFTEFFAYDANGKIIASSSARQIGKIVSAEPYYKASLLDSYI